jgi:hypothetical protein
MRNGRIIRFSQKIGQLFEEQRQAASDKPQAGACPLAALR